MMQIKDFKFDSLCNLITIAYNRVVYDVDLMIVEKTQGYQDLGFSEEEAKIQVLSKYREKAINDETTILKSLGKYRSAYDAFFDEDTESYLDGYSEKAARSLANNLLKSDNNITKQEFVDEAQLIEYLAEKIECFEIINRISILSEHGNKGEERVQDIPVQRTPIKDMIKFNRENNNYLFDYLEELKPAFRFDKISDLDFNAICLIIKEKGVFKKNFPFTEIVASIANYYGIKEPKDPKPNKCKLRKEELLKKHSILERTLI